MRQHGGMSASTPSSDQSPDQSPDQSSDQSPNQSPSTQSALWLTGALGIGAAVAVGLGAYGRHHEPTFESITTLGFATQIDMKVWLGVVAASLGLVQVVSALRMYGHLGRKTPSKAVVVTHRSSGALAVLVSLPVAFHCLWSLGFQDYSGRVLAHSMMGCLFYGAFVAKMLALKIDGLSGWVIPVLGATTFALLIGVVTLSSVWFLAQDTGGSSYSGS
jgi:hypothetical protein